MRLICTRMQKQILSLCWCFIMVSPVKPIKEELKWSSLKEVSVKLEQQQKPVLIDLYTDWCHWCKVMDKKTYSNQKVIDYLSEKFYAVKVNAETKESLTWANKTFTYNNSYSINDFALYATKGETGFPTTVILTNVNAEPIPISGFLEPRELEPILKYFGEGAYLTQTFLQYKKTFKATW